MSFKPAGFVTVDGKRLRVEYDEADSDELQAGTIVTINVADSEIEHDESDQSEADDSGVAYGIVAADYQPSVHGSNVLVLWFYDKNELPVAATALKKGQKVLGTVAAAVDVVCIQESSITSLALLPDSIFPGLYNERLKRIEVKQKTATFALVRELLLTRVVAYKQLGQLPSAVRNVVANQQAIADNLLQSGKYIFAGGNQKGKSKSAIALFLCFGPMVVGEALWVLVQGIVAQ
jgi:hypothetical protein